MTQNRCPECGRPLKRGVYCGWCEITWDADQLAAPPHTTTYPAAPDADIPTEITRASQRQELFDE